MRTLVAAVLMVFSSISQAQDSAELLKRAAAAMGADDLRTLRYSGVGEGASFGQAYRPGMAWPKLNYSSYVREIDYEAGAASEVAVRSRAEPTGGGAVPLTGEARAGGAVNGEFAWNLGGPSAVPRQAARAERLHDLWITPHGAVKAALKHGVSGEGLSFQVPGIMTARIFLNDQSLVERVESRYSDAVLGDIDVATDYWDYRDLGGIKMPMRVRQVRGGALVLDLEVREAQPNAQVDLAVPDNVRAAAGERVVAEKAAEGVWFLAGGSHNSVAIEMKDHVVLVEAPLYDGRVTAVLEEVKKLIPGKPVRYVVNSHSHFDHSGGVRAAVASGATLVVQQGAKAYFEKALANPSRITPDLLSKSGARPRVMGVASRHVFKDATRVVEIHHLRDPLHVDTFLMVYLPKERLLIEADAYTPGAPGAAAPAKPSPLHLNLVENLQRLKLKPERILPLHGRIVPASELYKAAGRDL
jgi:glyoxylase-like metal-dependent hydrolase (beta-lactamase superfamily II)